MVTWIRRNRMRLGRRLTEQVLQISSTSDGPWVEVSRVRRIVVRGAGKEDEIKLRFKDGDDVAPMKSVKIKGEADRWLRFTKGKMKVERVKGKSPITVLAMCERINYGAQTNVGHSVRGDSVA
jgi:hypothetical protein